MAEGHQAIRIVARRTGLSAHLIRMWENRYRAVTPERTGTNRRLYTDEQIERLILLRDLTRSGHSISHVAHLPTERLRTLARESGGNGHGGHVAKRAAAVKPTLFEEGMTALKALDGRALEETLKRAGIELGAQGALQRVVAPLVQSLGELWREGMITAAHEHFASAVIRNFLADSARPFAAAESGPALIVATPAGQIHEMGALLAAAAAANVGWRVTYLGVSLPAAEIAGAARQNRARAVALSVVYPEDDPRLEGELARLGDALPAGVSLIVGGRAMPAYRDVLERIGAIRVKDLSHLCATLDELRKPSARRKA